MPIPVINPTTSIPEVVRDAVYEYIPHATNGVLSWALDKIPEGFDFDTDTGAITTGPGTLPGLKILALTATNASGTSAELVLVWRIMDASESSNSSGFDVDLDVTSGLLALVDGSESLSLYGAVGDDILIYFRFRKGEKVLDLDLASLKVGVSLNEASPVLVSSTGFVKLGSGQATMYAVILTLERAKLKNTIGDYERPSGYKFDGTFEVEWKQNNTLGIGGATIRRTSRKAKFEIAVDKVEAA